MPNYLNTPVGKVMFAWIKNEEIIHKDGNDIPTGKYSITVSFPKEETEKLTEEINKAWDDFLEKDGRDKEFNLTNFIVPTRTVNEQTGFVFRKKVNIISKDTNQPVKLYVPIFDSENKNCTKNVAGIGRDSKVIVSYTLIPFYMNANNYGVSLRLQAIQLIDLVPLSSSGSRYGFGEVTDGYVAHNMDDESEIPY